MTKYVIAYNYYSDCKGNPIHYFNGEIDKHTVSLTPVIDMANTYNTQAEAIRTMTLCSLNNNPQWAISQII